MRRYAALCFAWTFALASAAQAQPPAPSQTLEDARCLLAMVALSNSTDPQQQRIGQTGAVYFTGRIAARDPTFPFARLKTIATTMNAQSVQTDLQQRCGPLFNKSMTALQAALAPPPGATSPSTPPPAPAPVPHKP